MRSENNQANSGYDGPQPAPLSRTMTLRSGQNPVIISKRLGHANVSITSDICAYVLLGWQRQDAAFALAMEEKK